MSVAVANGLDPSKCFCVPMGVNQSIHNIISPDLFCRFKGRTILLNLFPVVMLLVFVPDSVISPHILVAKTMNWFSD